MVKRNICKLHLTHKYIHKVCHTCSFYFLQWDMLNSPIHSRENLRLTNTVQIHNLRVACEIWLVPRRKSKITHEKMTWVVNLAVSCTIMWPGQEKLNNNVHFTHALSVKTRTGYSFKQWLLAMSLLKFEFTAKMSTPFIGVALH